MATLPEARQHEVMYHWRASGMLLTGSIERPEGPPPTEQELREVWNLIRDYQRAPNNNSNCLPAALRIVRGCGPAEKEERMRKSWGYHSYE